MPEVDPDLEELAKAAYEAWINRNPVFATWEELPGLYPWVSSQWRAVARAVRDRLCQQSAVKKCKHYWQYVHAVYSGRNDSDEVRRFCFHCGINQVGKVTRWRPERKNEFDQTAQEAAAEEGAK